MKIQEITEKIAALRADKHARHDALTVKEEAAITASIKALGAELVAEITDGAKECKCGSKPHGVVQEVAVKNERMAYFEIGCLECPDRRAQGFTRDQAVAKWNAEQFVKAK